MENPTLSFEHLPALVHQLTQKVESLTNIVQEMSKATVSAQDKLHDVAGAAQFLGLAEQTIYQMCQARRLPYMKQGKRLYFSEKELTEWLKSGRRKTNAELSAEATTYLKRKKAA